MVDSKDQVLQMTNLSLNSTTKDVSVLSVSLIYVRMIPQIEIVLFLTRRSYAYYVVVFVVSYPLHRLNIEPLDDIT